MSAPLPDLLAPGGPADAKREPRARARTGWARALRLWGPAGFLVLMLGRVLPLAEHLPGPQPGPRQRPAGRPPAAVARAHLRHRPGGQRRVLPHPVRRADLVRGRIRRHRHRPGRRRPAGDGRRLLGRRRRHDHLPPARRPDRVSRARARAGHRRGARPERGARHLGAVGLQHPGRRPDRARRHPGPARADLHPRGPAVGHQGVARDRAPHHPQHRAAAHDVQPARHRHRDHPGGRAQLPRPRHPAARGELGEHDRAGAADPVRRPPTWC